MTNKKEKNYQHKKAKNNIVNSFAKARAQPQPTTEKHSKMTT